MTADRTRRTLVGVDSSQEARDALGWARSHAGDDDEVVVVHTWQVPVVTGYDMVLTGEPEEIARLAKQGLDEYVGSYGDDRIVPVVGRGHAGRVLCEEAEHRDVDVVVVGHRGDSRVSMMLGSTASYVLHHTERPVVIVRGDRRNPSGEIVVGVDDHDLDSDGQNASVRALRWAYGLEGVDRVRVAHAWFLPSLAVGMYSAGVATDFGEMDAAAAAVGERVIEAAGPAPSGIEVVSEVLRGTPGFGLIEASRSVDLVVVGSRGRGGFAELLLGSTTATVAAHSHAPVAIVR